MKQIKDFSVVSNNRLDERNVLLRLKPIDGQMPTMSPGQFVQVMSPARDNTFLRLPISINNVDVDTVRISGNTIITTGSSNNDFSSCIAIYNVVGSNAHFNNLIVENNTLEQKGEEVYPIIDLACTRTGSELSILQHVLIRGNVIKVGNSNSVIKLEGNAANFQIQNISFEKNIVYCNSSNNLVFGGYDNVDCYKKILVKDCEFKNKKLELFRVHNARVSLMSTNNTYSSDQRGK